MLDSLGFLDLDEFDMMETAPLPPLPTIGTPESTSPEDERQVPPCDKAREEDADGSDPESEMIARAEQEEATEDPIAAPGVPEPEAGEPVAEETDLGRAVNGWSAVLFRGDEDLRRLFEDDEAPEVVSSPDEERSEAAVVGEPVGADEEDIESGSSCPETEKNAIEDDLLAKLEMLGKLEETIERLNTVEASPSEVEPETTGEGSEDQAVACRRQETPAADPAGDDAALDLRCPVCDEGLSLRRVHLGIEGQCVFCGTPIVAHEDDGEVVVLVLDGAEPEEDGDMGTEPPVDEIPDERPAEIRTEGFRPEEEDDITGEEAKPAEEFGELREEDETLVFGGLSDETEALMDATWRDDTTEPVSSHSLFAEEGEDEVEADDDDRGEFDSLFVDAAEPVEEKETGDESDYGFEPLPEAHELGEDRLEEDDEFLSFDRAAKPDHVFEEVPVEESAFAPLLGFSSSPVLPTEPNSAAGEPLADDRLEDADASFPAWEKPLEFDAAEGGAIGEKSPAVPPPLPRRRLPESDMPSRLRKGGSGTRRLDRSASILLLILLGAFSGACVASFFVPVDSFQVVAKSLVMEKVEKPGAAPLSR